MSEFGAGLFILYLTKLLKELDDSFKSAHIFLRFEPMFFQIGLFLLLSGADFQPRYTLMLIDRPFIEVDSVVVGPEFVEYRKTGKRKFRSLERDKIYAIRSADGRIDVVYLPDSLEGNWYTAEQMSYYIQGQEDAGKHYGKRANVGLAAGVMLGAAASVSRLYGSVVIAAYPGFVGYLKPSFSAKRGFQPQFAENVFYKEGYGTMAKRMATRRAFWGTLSGYVAGTIALSFVFK